MTPQERLVRRALTDCIWYCETNLKVLDKQTLRLVPLRFKPAQRRLLEWMLGQYEAGKPVRVIILKARREGVSTAIQAFFFWLTSLRRHQIAVTLSHHDDTTRALHAISERYYQHLPAGKDDPASVLRPKRRQTRRGTVMEFANPTKDEAELARQPGLESSMSTTTAKNAGAGQGANLVHCSEVGLWEGNQIDAKSVLDTLLQIVPLAPKTVICLESTARGVGNEFYLRWKAAERSLAEGVENDFYPFFIPWFEEETSVVPGVGWDELGELSDREERLRERYDVSSQQLAWRRWAVRTLCGGDEDTFDQEYPESADVAFLSSGRPFFDQEAVSEYLDWALTEKPVGKGDLVERDGRISFVESGRRGRLTVWEPPQQGEDYLISCDSSEGSGSGDPQHAYVFKRSSLQVVAAWHSRVDRDELGDILFCLGHVYNYALVAVEINGGWGLTPNAILRRRGYHRVYRMRTPNKVRKHRAREQRWGWDTTPTNRPLILDALSQAIRDGELDCADPELFRECLVFAYSDSGKPQAMPGEHDDRVMAAAIGVHLWQTEPIRKRNLAAAVGG